MTTTAELAQGEGLGSVVSQLSSFAARFRDEALAQPTTALVEHLNLIEDAARIIEQLQIVAAHAVTERDIARNGETGKPVAPASKRRTEFRDNADYLRCRLRISRSEARRRIRLGEEVLSVPTPTGHKPAPRLEVLAGAVERSAISGQAATLISDAVERTRTLASPEDLHAMERQLSHQAEQSDIDMLRVMIRRWEDLLDPDGLEPAEETLRARQGAFLRGKRAGLHLIEISASDEQFEQLVTVMNAATNPRASNSREAPVGNQQPTDDGAHLAEGVEEPTRAQLMLEGLSAACRIALSADQLPASGGLRPQVMVTIKYEDLVAEEGRAGQVAFAGHLSARSVRKLACDAGIIPVVFGSDSEVLDVGRAQRLFSAAQRRALVARDGGCSFPDCTIPAPWCEAHHVLPWENGGATSVGNGVLVCSRHHHLVHEGNWCIRMVNGRPWFVPPRYVDPDQVPRINRYHRVAEELNPPRPPRTPGRLIA